MMSGPTIAAELAPVVPTLELTAQDDSINVRAFVAGQPQHSVSTTLTIHRTSSSGTMNTSQSRDVTFVTTERVEVAATGLSLGQNARLTVELVVESDGVVVARSRTSIGDGS